MIFLWLEVLNNTFLSLKMLFPTLILTFQVELAKKLKKVDLDCPKDFMRLMNCPELTQRF